MNKLTITKLEAARVQLESAIQLYVEGKHPVSIHTLASAAYTILLNINEKRGGGPMIKDLPKFAPPDRAKDIRHRMTRSQNFFKHADKNPEGVIEFNPQETPLPMFEAVFKYQELAQRTSPIMLAFAAWFLIQNESDIPPDTPIGKALQLVKSTDPPTNREEFFKEFVPIIADSMEPGQPDGA